MATVTADRVRTRRPRRESDRSFDPTRLLLAVEQAAAERAEQLRSALTTTGADQPTATGASGDA